MMYMRPFEPFFRSPVPWLFQPGFGHNKSILYVIQCRHDIRNLPSETYLFGPKHTLFGRRRESESWRGNTKRLKIFTYPRAIFCSPELLATITMSSTATPIDKQTTFTVKSPFFLSSSITHFLSTIISTSFITRFCVFYLFITFFYLYIQQFLLITSNLCPQQPPLTSAMTHFFLLAALLVT